MKSVMFVIALTALVAGAAAQRPVTRTTYSVRCETLTNCESCAEKHFVSGNLAAPCHWNWESHTCGSYPSPQEAPCQGNQASQQGPCRQCENAYKAYAARKAAQSQQSQSKGASAPGAVATAGAGSGAAPAAKSRNRCTFNDAGGNPLTGVCVFSADRCRGNPSSAKPGNGCPADKQHCCAAVIKGGKAARNDACSQHSGANNCGKCVAAVVGGRSCVMHIRTGMCVKSNSNLGRAGDKNLVADAAFCHKAREVKTARLSKIAEAQKRRLNARQNAGQQQQQQQMRRQ